MGLADFLVPQILIQDHRVFGRGLNYPALSLIVFTQDVLWQAIHQERMKVICTTRLLHQEDGPGKDLSAEHYMMPFPYMEQWNINSIPQIVCFLQAFFLPIAVEVLQP